MTHLGRIGLLVILCCVSSYAYENRVNAKNPGFPNMCYLNRSPTPLLMKIGESRYLQQSCEQAICQVNSELVIKGCGIPRIQNNCRLNRDITRPYPACCPTVKCS